MPRNHRGSSATAAAPARPISLRAQATAAASASRQKDLAVEYAFGPRLLDLIAGGGGGRGQQRKWDILVHQPQQSVGLGSSPSCIGGDVCRGGGGVGVRGGVDVVDVGMRAGFFNCVPAEKSVRWMCS